MIAEVMGELRIVGCVNIIIFSARNVIIAHVGRYYLGFADCTSWSGIEASLNAQRITSLFLNI